MMFRTGMVLLALLITVPGRAEPAFDAQIAATLQAGQKPREVLTVAPAPGTVEMIVLRWQTRSTLAGSPDLAMSPIDLTLKVTPRTEDPLTLDLEVTDVVSKHELEGLTALKSAKGKLVVTPRGFVRELTFQLDSKYARELEDMLWLVLVPYPKDAIGIGAHWQSTEVARIPHKVRRSGVFRLVDASTIDLELSRASLGKHQHPFDRESSIESHDEHGRGKATRTPGHVFLDIDELVMKSTTKVVKGKQRLDWSGVTTLSVRHP